MIKMFNVKFFILAIVSKCRRRTKIGCRFLTRALELFNSQLDCKTSKSRIGAVLEKSKKEFVYVEKYHV